jgi:hypothetical protein
MRRPATYALLALLLLVAGAVAFGVGRYLLAGTGSASAQPSDDIPQKVDQDKATPKFEGEINGFVFYDPEKVPVKQPTACAGLAGGDDATKADISASPLNFTVGNLPPGAELTFEGGNKCRGIVVAVIRDFGIKGGAQIAVARIAASPEIPAEAPASRLQAATVAGRPAVIVAPVFDGDRVAVYMRDAAGYWMVSGAHTTLDAVIKVAEAVK